MVGLAALAVPHAAFAERIYGVVSTVNPYMNFLSVTRQVLGRQTDLRVVIDERTRLMGMDSLGDLGYGDTILVNGELDPQTNTLTAYYLRSMTSEVYRRYKQRRVFGNEDVENSKSFYLRRSSDTGETPQETYRSRGPEYLPDRVAASMGEPGYPGLPGEDFLAG